MPTSTQPSAKALQEEMARLRRDLHRALEERDAARSTKDAAVRQTAQRVAAEVQALAYADGKREGAFAALCPQHPEHAATVAAYQARTALAEAA